MNKKSAIVEFILGLFLCFGYIWTIYPLYSYIYSGISFLIFFLLLFYSHKSRKQSWRDIGISKNNFVAASKSLAIITIFSAITLSFLWNFFFPINPQNFDFKRMGLNILRYPLWALFQQYVVLAFFF